MDDLPIVVGSIVQLRSGGPLMTVIDVVDDPENPQAFCAFFTEKGDTAQYWFPFAALDNRTPLENSPATI
ncbi:MAG: DUF2158 domain-containing protein [Gammaproteobacteria bacterium]|nr:DUF2158 domain-containing protein [Gammaproteobacteria bacterium]